MKTINRSALTIIPNQPYIDWPDSFNIEIIVNILALRAIKEYTDMKMIQAKIPGI